MSSNPSRKKATGRVTLRDVADKAGVSIITVSRALRGLRKVDPEIVVRVQALALSMGYVPDPVARALVSSRSSTVVVLVPLLSNTVFVDLLEAVQATLLPAGYQTIFGVTHYDPAEEERLLRGYLQHRPAGLVMTGFDRTEGARALIAASALPCVHMMDLSPAPGLYSVGFVNRDAGYAMTRHLIGRGRKRIAFVGAQLDTRTMQRAEGYRRALKEAGMYDPGLEFLTPEQSSVALGARIFSDAVERRRGIDGIFFCNDDLAHGALLEALRRKIRVPEEIAVGGFNDLPGSDQTIPPLTTVGTPRWQIGVEAANMLLSLIDGQPVASSHLDVGFSLVERGST